MSSLKRKDILDIQSLHVDEINLICTSAKYFKDVFTRSIKNVPVLRGKSVCTLFFEPSTRTRLSFDLAAKRLSADLINVNVFWLCLFGFAARFGDALALFNANYISSKNNHNIDIKFHGLTLS